MMNQTRFLRLLTTRFLRLLTTLCLLSLVTLLPGLTSAQQNNGTVDIASVDDAGYPQVTLVANVLNSVGQPISGLDAGNFSLGGDLAANASICGPMRLSAGLKKSPPARWSSASSWYWMSAAAWQGRHWTRPRLPR